MLIEMLGFFDAEDIEERGNDGHNRQVENTGNEQTEEHLSDYMQGMGCKGTVIQPPVTYH